MASETMHRNGHSAPLERRGTFWLVSGGGEDCSLRPPPDPGRTSSPPPYPAAWASLCHSPWPPGKGLELFGGFQSGSCQPVSPPDPPPNISPHAAPSPIWTSRCLEGPGAGARKQEELVASHSRLPSFLPQELYAGGLLLPGTTLGSPPARPHPGVPCRLEQGCRNRWERLAESWLRAALAPWVEVKPSAGRASLGARPGAPKARGEGLSRWSATPGWTGTWEGYSEARASGCGKHGRSAAKLFSHLRYKRLRRWLCQDGNCSTTVLRVGQLQQPGKAAGETSCGQTFTPMPRGKEVSPLQRFSLLHLKFTSILLLRLVVVVTEESVRLCIPPLTLELWLASASHCWEAAEDPGGGLPLGF